MIAVIRSELIRFWRPSIVYGGTGLMAGFAAMKAGFPLPSGMRGADLVMAGFIGALGLTVALFVASAAFIDPDLQGQAKMGALFSGFVGIAAVLLGRLFGFGAREEAGGPASINQSAAAVPTPVPNPAPASQGALRPEPAQRS